MSRLAQKRILLGVTGGIAAYKSAELLRRLQDEGAELRVVMTNNAGRFVTPLTFQALSGHPVTSDMFSSEHDGMEHVSLARWADCIVIAPASANSLAKLAHGMADDLLTTLCLAAEIPIALTPAMNQAMWNNPATRANVEELRQRGMAILGPASGGQACGESGEGRMLEPPELVERIAGLFRPPLLQGLSLLITAGPTRESLDPVRYLSNRSSGKMGFALAKAASAMGAQVTLVSGPVSFAPPAGVDSVTVNSAAEMHAEVMSRVAASDIFIAAAAVSDYRPLHIAGEKIKKSADRLQLELVRNPDILADVASSEARPFCVGFAAETENLEDNALEKLQRKQLDMIAANWVGEAAERDSTGFDSDDNALHVYSRDSDTLLRKNSKARIAEQLMELIAEHYDEKHPSQNP